MVVCAAVIRNGFDPICALRFTSYLWAGGFQGGGEEMESGRVGPSVDLSVALSVCLSVVRTNPLGLDVSASRPAYYVLGLGWERVRYHAGDLTSLGTP